MIEKTKWPINFPWKYTFEYHGLKAYISSCSNTWNLAIE